MAPLYTSLLTVTIQSTSYKFVSGAERHLYLSALGTYMALIAISVPEHLTVLNVFILTTCLCGREILLSPFSSWRTVTERLCGVVLHSRGVRFLKHANMSVH